MALAITIKGPSGSTASLTAEQLKVVEPLIVNMMNGKVSVKLTNDLVIQKLENAGMPLVFEEPQS